MKKLFEKLSSNPFMAGALGFAAGTACTAALLLLIFIPGVVNLSGELNSLTASFTAAEDEFSRVSIEAERSINRLEHELATAWEQIRRIEEITAFEDHEQRLQLAVGRLNAGYFYEAARIIERVNPLALSSCVYRVYVDTKNSSFRAASEDLYNDGIFYFANGNTAASRKAFESSLHFIADGAPFEHDIVFFLGRIAQIEGDYELARQYYIRVLEEFPQSGRIPEANIRLAELTG